MYRKLFFVLCLLLISLWGTLAFGAERASFGLMIKAVSVEYAQFIGLATPEGAYVVSAPSSGDLRPGDVILKVDDTSIKAPADLQAITRQYLPGDQVQLQSARGKERIQISYTLKSAPVSTNQIRPGQPSRASNILGDFPTVESSRFEQEVLKSDKGKTGYIRTTELADYVDNEVPILAEKVFKWAQYPTISISGQVFPIGKVK